MDNRDGFISIACGSITLDFRDYARMLVDRSNNSLQRSLEDLLHYKFLTTVRNFCLDIAGEAHLVQHLADPLATVL